MTIRTAVIGVGYLGKHHARIYAELPDAELVAVVDANQAIAEEIAGQYGCRAVTDYRLILDDVDAVSIVTPTTYHHAIARDCIAAGKDILIEKPITTTIEEADDLIQKADHAGVLVQVGHLERFNPIVAELMPLLNGPVFLEATRVGPFLGRGTDVDITLDLMIHDIDVILSLMPDSSVIDVKATGTRLMTQTIDFAKAWLEFDNGASALLTASRVSTDRARTLIVHQKDSHIVMDYQAMEIRRHYAQDGVMAHELITVERCEPLKEEIRHFLGCVDTRSIPRVCALKGRNALYLALRAGAEIKKRWK
jgi:predicted dehydrogenase